jgi:ankyrin repeat protein
MNANDLPILLLLQQQAEARAEFFARQEKISALHHPIAAGNLEAVQKRIAQDGCAIVAGKGGPGNCTALQAACRAGRLEIVQYLVMDPISTLTNGREILCGALGPAALRDRAVLQFLCEKMDPPPTEVDLCEVVDETCQQGLLECLAYLVETHGAKVGLVGLRAAARRGHLNTVQYVFRSETHSFVVNSCEGRDVFYDAFYCFRTREVVEWLVSEGIDVNACMSDGFPPLAKAVIRVEEDNMRYLCSLGADVNAQFEGRTPLEMACFHGFLEFVKFLHNKGAFVTSRALHNVAKGSGELEIAKYICEEVDGVDINDRGNGGKSALHFAANGWKPDLVSYLLQKGANPNISDDHDDTPLHLIVRAGICEEFQNAHATVAALLQAGANPMLSNEQGQTPMSCALSRTDLPSAPHLTLIFLLLEHGGFSGITAGVMDGTLYTG